MTSWQKFRQGLTLWWYRLWVRREEFHPSLDMDVGAMESMTPGERVAYREDLLRRRHIAHMRYIAREDSEFRS